MGLLGKTLLTALGLFVLFIGFGMSIPEYKSKANAARRVCEKGFIPKGLATQYACDQAYSEAMRQK